MKKFYFDIETIPANESSRQPLEYLYERKVSKKMKEKNLDRDAAILEVGTFEKYFDNTGFDGAFGRVLCIAYAINDEATRVICNDGNEKKTLEDFWFVAGQIDLFVGHNIMEFDLRFLIQRSIVLGVEPTWTRFSELGKKPWDMVKHLSFARYQNLPIFDTMQEWSNWGQGKVGLEHIALALGIPTPKEGIDGSEVAKFYNDGKIKDICDYCMRDVETTRAVYQRMTFAKTTPF
jgi:predicted PolB exonuclease-like 3'-5' exonuclease